jgi:hypothetical protein
LPFNELRSLRVSFLSPSFFAFCLDVGGFIVRHRAENAPAVNVARSSLPRAEHPSTIRATRFPDIPRVR